MNLNRKFFRSLLVCLACCGAWSCDSSTGNPESGLVLDKPLAERRILAFENSTLRADVFINNGPVQSFTILPQQDLTVGVTGIRVGQSNTINVKWTEILNGFDVELSDQNQTFIAEGNVQINAPHLTTQYDYDGDGADNTEERAAGTCVWSADESCLQQGQIDRPSEESVAETPITPTGTGGTDSDLTELEATVDTTIPPPNFQFDYDNAIAIIDEDFSGGVGLWFANVTEPTDNGGELCSTLPATATSNFVDLAVYMNTFSLQSARYSIEFDIRASRQTIALVTLVTPPPHQSILEQGISVSESWESKIISYEHFGETTVFFSLSALTPPSDTTYCIDNVRLLQER